LPSTRQTANQHSAAGAHADLGQVFSVNAVTLETGLQCLTSCRCAGWCPRPPREHVSVRRWAGRRFGKIPIVGLPATRRGSIDFRDPPCTVAPSGIYGLSIEDYILRNPAGEGIAFFAGESGESFSQFTLNARARRQKPYWFGCPSLRPASNKCKAVDLVFRFRLLNFP